jgi:hypothetical protein
MVERKRNLYNILIVAFVALGSFAFGYSNTIIGTTLAQPSFMYVRRTFIDVMLNVYRSYFALDKRPNSSAISGATSGLYTGGGRQYYTPECVVLG